MTRLMRSVSLYTLLTCCEGKAMASVSIDHGTPRSVSCGIFFAPPTVLCATQRFMIIFAVRAHLQHGYVN